MKKLFPLLALMCMFVLQGCPQPAPEEQDVLTPIKTEYTIGAEGGELSLTFKSNLSWTAKSDASWLKVTTPTKAVTTETVKVVASENTSTESRKANVTITAGSLSATIVVTQEGMVPSIVINGSTQFPVSAEGGEVTVDVTSNVDYEVEIGVNWITRNGNTFTVEPNDSEEDRTAVITFSYGNISKVVSIKQNGKTPEPYLEIAPETKNVTAEGETFNVTVSTNQGTATGTASADWVTVNGTSVTVAANPNTTARTATVTFTAGSLSKTVTINQEAKPDTPEPPVEENVLENGGAATFNVVAAGEDIEVVIRSNVEYSVDCAADWIVRTKASTVREDKLTFHVAANEATSPRTAEIVFTYGEELVVTVTVNQAAHEEIPDDPVLEISPMDAQVEAEGGEITVTVNANYEYTADCYDDWITIESGETSCVITVAPNTDTKPRNTQVMFFSEGLTEFFSIVQKGLIVEDNPFDVSGHGNVLSWNGTANCYVVIKEGNYSFDASVVGNGAEGYLWDDARAIDALLWPQSAELTTIAKGLAAPDRAYVYWNDGDVINNVKYNKSSKTITFTATGNKGAALIGLFDKYSRPETILNDEAIWSWLIWCTDSPGQFVQYDLDDNEYVLLDRNIGATSANPEDGTATYGYYFQWGRPNPLKAYIGMANDYHECEAEMKAALSHPTVVYKLGSHTGEWYNTGKGHLFNVTADLWGDPRHKFATVGEGAVDQHPGKATQSELKKTIYDPCPPGFMVAPERTWEKTTLDAVDDLYPITFLENGVNIRVENGDTFYPYAGYIAGLQSGESGYATSLGWFGFYGYKTALIPEGSGHMCWDYRTQAAVYTSSTGTNTVWTSDDEPGTQWLCYGAKFLYLSPDGSFWDHSGSVYGSVRQRGFPVRCVKEFNN